MKLARSVPIILVIILALTAFDSPRAAAQTDCARTPIDMSTMTGSWSSESDCHSPNRPIDPEGRGDGIYYAAYYDLHVSQTSEVTITLESSTDTYLYLLTGAGRDGEILAKNDDIDYDDDNLNSRITQTLEPGNYSLEATTYAKEATGDFTLTVEGIDFATPAATERAALIALYNATDGDNWRRNENWLSDAPLDEWDGVDTDENGRVEEISLEHNNLSGQIPSELGNLTNLDYLYLDSNQLTGTIPPELGALTNLVILYLDYNQLTGTIPPGLGNLTNLEDLYLNYNQLTGAIPPELGALTNLEILYLDSNQLTGAIPSELGNLTNLDYLYLDSNQLTGTIPPELGNLSDLRQLYLHENELTGEIPSVLGNLVNLRDLWLNDNRLTGTIPSELGNLSDLRQMYLHENELTGEVPSALGNLVNLQDLWLNDNLLTGNLPQSLISLTELHSFFFDGNDGLCAPDDAALQTWLRSIKYHGGIICGRPPITDERDLAALTALYNATDGPNWNDNEDWLTDAPLNDWDGVVTNIDGRVIVLNLLANNMSGHIPPELENLSELQQLALGGNRLTGTIPPELGNLSNLEILEIGANRLTGTIPSELSRLSKLNELRVYRNQLTGELPSELTQLGNLDTLYFHNNAGLCAPADTAFQEWLQSVVNVQGPTCEDTPQQPDPVPSECTQSISAAAPEQGAWTSNCVSTNRTEDGEYYAKYYTFTLDRPTTVKVLLESRTDSYIFLLDSDGDIVTKNDDYKYRNAGFLATLQPGAYTIEATTYSTRESGDFTLTMKQPELDALHALYNATDGANWENSDNWLTGAPLSDWHGVETDEEGRVIEIYLVGNNLSGEIPRELGDLSELQWLFLSRNSLSGSIPQELGNLHNLKILMLSNNELTGSIPARLGNMASLEELHLDRNRLSGRIPASLGRLENLRKLSLTVNELSGSIPAELANLSSLRTLSIAANELSGPIPYQLTDMENLTHIYLWGNDLDEGSFVRYLGDLESLQFLDIGGNDIDGAEVLAELDSLPNLTGLGLHDSGLTDADLLQYMDDLQALSLEFLNLSGNRLSDLQILVGLSRITTLQRIAINDNDFSGQLPRSMTALTLMRLFYFHDNDGLCAPDDSEFQDWLRGSPEIREFLRGGYPDVKGPTCTSGTTPANAPAPAANSADQFAAVLQTPEQLVPPHSLSLLESIQPGG